MKRKRSSPLLGIALFVIVVAGTVSISQYLSWTRLENTSFGYSIRHPRAWVVEPESSLVNDVNNMYSIVNIYSASRQQGASVQVSENDIVEALKGQAVKNQSLRIAGKDVTAYIFKSEYEECGALEPGRCAYILIPIEHNSRWYTLSASGELDGVDGIYKKVLTSFKLRD